MMQEVAWTEHRRDMESKYNVGQGLGHRVGAQSGTKHDGQPMWHEATMPSSIESTTLTSHLYAKYITLFASGCTCTALAIFDSVVSSEVPDG